MLMFMENRVSQRRGEDLIDEITNENNRKSENYRSLS
jgi:hypothetical protein